MTSPNPQPGLPPIHRPVQRESLLTAWKSILEIIVCSLFVTTFIAQPFRIPSSSMEPTLRVGDFLLVDKQSYGPTGLLDHLLPPAQVKRGDLVVFHYPVDPSLHLVKRVIGLPGDHLRLRQGQVWVNGRQLVEPYAFYSSSPPNAYRDDFPSLQEADPSVDLRWWIQLHRTVRGGEITVPPGQYFVLGDNRNDSEDSRYWGFVPRRDLVGRPWLVYFSIPSAEATLDDTPLQRLGDTFRLGLHSWRVLR